MEEISLHLQKKSFIFSIKFIKYSNSVHVFLSHYTEQQHVLVKSGLLLKTRKKNIAKTNMRNAYWPYYFLQFAHQHCLSVRFLLKLICFLTESQSNTDEWTHIQPLSLLKLIKNIKQKFNLQKLPGNQWRNHQDYSLTRNHFCTKSP